MVDSDAGPASILGVWDYVVVVLLLLTSSSIGLYYRLTGGKQNTIEEFMLADGSMPFVPVAFSLMASFMSAITLLGVVQEMYMYGTMFITINIAYIISTPIVCYVYLPVFYHLRKISVYKYLELRFGYATRLLASLSFTLQMTLYTGIVLYAPALALAAVTGLSQSLSIALVGSVCTLYSALGGMKAVLITDVLQSLLMFAAILIVLVTGLRTFSLQEVFSSAAETGRLEFFVLELDPRTRHSIWTQVVGGCITYLSLYAVNQAQVQRLLACRTLRQSQAAVWLQWPILLTLSLSTALAGLIIAAQYRHCDPLLAGLIRNPDQLLPLYVVQHAASTPGVTGLFVAGVFSGSLSTVSSSLTSLAAVTLTDYLQPLLSLCRGRPVLLAAYWSAAISVLYGGLCIGLAFVTALLGSGVLQASLTVFGAVGGPLLGLFTVGMTTTAVTQRGAMSGLLVGLALCLWVGFGQPKPAPVYKARYVDGCEAPNSTEALFHLSANASLPRFLLTETSSEAAHLTHWSPSVHVNNVGHTAELLPDSLHADNSLLASKNALLKPRDLRIAMRAEATGGDQGFAPRGQTFNSTARNSGLSPDPAAAINSTQQPDYNFLHEVYAISYAWIGTLGFVSTYVTACLVSIGTRCVQQARLQEVDEALLAPCCRRRRGGGRPPGSDEEHNAFACTVGVEKLCSDDVISNTKL